MESVSCGYRSPLPLSGRRVNMAVSKLWSINEDGLSRVLQYAANPKKTNNKLYISGINCEPETAYEEFTAVKRSYAKADGIEAYHGYRP